mmetsp:Transcript_17520/g.28546  ORF Transcript_17520/g.28546 Transcript_17520/m.28546 type:complete len:388 (+) Transcript_17520:87-1250(+)
MKVHPIKKNYKLAKGVSQGTGFDEEKAIKLDGGNNDIIRRKGTCMPDSAIAGDGKVKFKHETNDVMVSYCRRNTPFVKSLVQFLNDIGIDPWVDWEDIPPAVDWMKQITKGIINAYAFICVLSPEYLESKICLEELQIALDSGKLIVPIVCKDIDWSSPKLPKALAEINFIFVRETDDKAAGFAKVDTALHTDQEYVHNFEELSRTSVHYFDEPDPNKKIDLLATNELLGVYEQTIMIGSVRIPKPTKKMINFVQDCRSQAKKNRALEQRQQMIIGAILALLLVVMTIGIIISITYYHEAKKSKEDAEAAEAEAMATAEDLQATLNWFYCSFYFFSAECYTNTTSVFPGRDTMYIYNYRNLTFDAIYKDLSGHEPPNLDCPAILVDR